MCNQVNHKPECQCDTGWNSFKKINPAEGNMFQPVTSLTRNIKHTINKRLRADAAFKLALQKEFLEDCTSVGRLIEVLKQYPEDMPVTCGGSLDVTVRKETSLNIEVLNIDNVYEDEV